MKKIFKAVLIIFMMPALFLLAGCEIERRPMDPPTPVTEIPDGPGLFTGEDGAIVITN